MQEIRTEAEKMTMKNGTDNSQEGRTRKKMIEEESKNPGRNTRQ